MPAPRELVDIRAAEVSAVAKAANRRQFLVLKREAGTLELTDDEIAALAAAIVKQEQGQDVEARALAAAQQQAAKAAADGTPMTDDQVKALALQIAQVQRDGFTCPKCGTKAYGGKFCAECGADLITTAAPAATDQGKHAMADLKIEKRDAGYVVEGLPAEQAAQVAKALTDQATELTTERTARATAERELAEKRDAEATATFVTKATAQDALPGEVKARATILQRVAKFDAALGEELANYFDALNTALKAKGGVTREVGKTAADALAADGPLAQLEAIAAELVAKSANGALAHVDAMKQARRQRPDLYEAYREQVKQGRKTTTA
jgi:hypothetical protein